MSEQGTFVEEGIERIQNAVDSVEEEFQKLQRNVQERREGFEKEARKQFKRADKRARIQVKRVQTELLKNPVVKRAEDLRKDINKQVENRMDSFFGLLPYATRQDVKRLERKVSQLTRKLNQLEKTAKSAASEEPRSEIQH